MPPYGGQSAIHPTTYTLTRVEVGEFLPLDVKIATKLDARESSANCVISEYTGTSWKDLCNKAEELIKQLNK